MPITARSAMRLVLLFGLVSLFADMTYEGARSFFGPFLGILGASGTVVGAVAGFGELLGYSVRLVSGALSDRTRRYWMMTFLGYGINLLAVPALALAGSWQIAAALIILERFGKGVRTPPRDAMLSHATRQVGSGWGFGIHEAMDQIGAVLGPLIVAVVLFVNGDYRQGFAVLLIPALVALSVLFVARKMYARPQELEPLSSPIEGRGYSQRFLFYLTGVALVAAGFADFALIGFHFGRSNAVSMEMIPVLYAVAMGSDAIAALVFGRMFDKIGLAVLVLAVALSSFFAPCVFLGGFGFAILGVALWGVGMGAQESVMRAAVTNMVHADRRGTAFGVFNTCYGLAWFAGSAAMGVLYDFSILALVAFSVIVQLASLPFLAIARRSGGPL
ncbi:MAG: MFS transporter [Thermoplasmata archaeon]